MTNAAPPRTRRDWRTRVRQDEVDALGIEPLVSAEAVALVLGIDRSTVYRMAGKSDGLVCVEIGPGRLRFRPADVRAYVERRTLQGVAVTRAEKLFRASG